MKVKHSWLHTVMMCCDLLITIKRWENALEHNDSSALSWPRVFLKNNVASDDDVLHKSKFLTLFHPLGTEKWPLGTAVFIARGLSSLLSTCRQFAGKQPAECQGRNSLLILAKNLRLIHLKRYRIFAPVKVVTEAKLLGLVFDCRLSFKNHIQYPKTLCQKANDILRVVGHTDWVADCTVLLRLYRSLVRSKLDYGCIVYLGRPVSRI